MSNIAIQVANLSKKYQIGHRGDQFHDTLRDTVAAAFAAPFRKFSSSFSRNGYHSPKAAADADVDPAAIWALKEVSFEVKQGEVIGIIGRNGAGKSTLLKILSRITHPTAGFAKIHGRIGSLLEVGTGFHDELTGKENIYLSGAILGMRKTEIDRKLDEIIDFSGVEKFLDTPVKRYSSGMKMRLAFAVAAHLEPEILIVDEVLAVGDMAFQRKCLGKMERVAQEGRTVVFVSHNMTTVQALCQRGIVLSEGRIVVDTNAADAVNGYVADSISAATQPLADREDREGNGQLRFSHFWMENGKGARVSEAMTGEHMRFCFAYQSTGELRDVEVAFTLQDIIGNPIINCHTTVVGRDFAVLPKSGVFVCEIRNFPLRAARYTGNVFSAVKGSILDWVHGAFIVNVLDGDFYGTGKLPDKGKVLVAHDWCVLRTAEGCLRSESPRHQFSGAGEKTEA